jgi:hypothetical protein
MIGLMAYAARRWLLALGLEVSNLAAVQAEDGRTVRANMISITTITAALHPRLVRTFPADMTDLVAEVTSLQDLLVGSENSTNRHGSMSGRAHDEYTTKELLVF